MMYENDKLVIPMKYQKMSVSELRCEKEKLYTQIKKEKETNVEKTSTKSGTTVFRF